MINLDRDRSNPKLVRTICDEIERAKHHYIAFSRFMELALCAPNVGYYQATQQVVGSQGDFTTAPEISSWFSACLATYCQPILQSLPPNSSVIMEIGPGTGRMAADLLLALERLGCLPSCYIAVEVSDSLRQQQYRNLNKWVPHLMSRIQFRANLPAEAIEGIILANEVIDALPVERFCIEEGELYEYYVGYDQGRFVWKIKEPSTDIIRNTLKWIQNTYLEGVKRYTSEIRLSLEDWFTTVQACLSKGYILFIDYGKPAHEYYHPARYNGTLRCYYQHSLNTEPLKRVGYQDITSEVNFSQVADLALKAGLGVRAFVSQAAFLLASGILAAFNPDDLGASYLPTKSKVYQLISPTDMGESCKVMVLERGLHCDLLSLNEYDKRFSL